MIRIFFDHQCELNKKLWEYRFFNLLINELSEDNEFEIIHSINEIDSLDLLKDNEFDIFCPTGLNKYYLKKLNHNKKLCLFIHNMIYDIYGNYETNNISNISKYVKHKSEQIFLADKILFPSFETNEFFNIIYKELDDIIPVTNKTKIIPYGIKLLNINVDDTENPILNYPYLLYTNYRIDLIDYHQIIKLIFTLSDWLKEKNIKLVITGENLNNELLSIINNYELYNYIIYYEFNNIDELYNLYKNALCQICPEYVEGFPYYVIEGWNTNCLTLMNEENKIFNNISEDNGMYFNFDNLVDELNVLLEMDSSLYKELVNRQKDQLQMFNINNYIELYKKTFKDMING